MNQLKPKISLLKVEYQPKARLSLAGQKVFVKSFSGG
jgi:hypothetical protein